MEGRGGERRRSLSPPQVGGPHRVDPGPAGDGPRDARRCGAAPDGERGRRLCRQADRGSYPVREPGARLAREGGMKPASEVRILIVEDDVYFQRILQKRLEAEGYQVHCAGDGREGMKAIVTWDPDLVISDWMMPHVDGL